MTSPPIEQLATIEFSQADPLYTLLRRLRCAAPGRFAVTYTVTFILAHAFFFLAVNARAPGELARVIDEYCAPQNLIYAVLVVPSIAAFYGWINLSSVRLFVSLARADIWATTESREHAVLELEARACAVSSSRAPTIVAVLAILLGLVPESSAVFLGGHSYLSPYQGSSSAVHRLSFITIAPIACIGYYFVVVIIIRELQVLLGLRSVFKNRSIRLQPLHPDNCGGLGSIGQYALNVSYFIAALGVGVSIAAINADASGSLRRNVIVVPAAILYIGLSPVLFFATLGAAHQQMHEAKADLLRRISDQFVTDFQVTSSSLGSSSKELKCRLDKIDQLRKLYRVADGFRVWPFDARSLQKFWTAFLAPTIPLIISALLGRFLGTS